MSDTTTLRYLILIESVGILPRMYGPISVPAWVYDRELQDPATPEPVRIWMSQPPPWILRDSDFPMDPTLPARQLGRGEREAISLAIYARTRGDEALFLTDDRVARREALRCGVPVVRTLGLLVDAAGRGLETPEAIRRLEHLPERFPDLKPFYAKPFHFAEAWDRALAGWSRNAPKEASDPDI